MPAEELKEEIKSGIYFFGDTENGVLIAVMGIQPVGDVTLIRHAYTLTSQAAWRGAGEKLSEPTAQLSPNRQDSRGHMGNRTVGNQILPKTRVYAAFKGRNQ